MENMDKGLTVPTWVLIVWLKIPQMPKMISANLICLPKAKSLGFSKKNSLWVSVVRVLGILIASLLLPLKFL